MLDKVPARARRAEAGELLCGTIDSWVIWRLTGGNKAHVTDATNASRTLLFDIQAQAWSDEMLALFDVPRALLPARAGLRGRLRPGDAGHPGPPPRRSAAWPATSRRR